MPGPCINPKKRIYDRVIKMGKTKVSARYIHSMGMGLPTFKSYLIDFNRRLIDDPDNVNAYLVVPIKNNRPVGYLPCMRPDKNITCCQHADNCYLSGQCPAAKKLLSQRDDLYYQMSDAFAYMRDSNIGRM